MGKLVQFCEFLDDDERKTINIWGVGLYIKKGNYRP